jgi:CRP/FNR family transcriptional regulator
MSLSKQSRIKQVPLLHGLDDTEIGALAARAVEKRYGAGDTLFSEGESCEGVFLVLDGRVKIFKTSSSGREITLAVESAPSAVAEVPLFDGGSYPASVAALGDVNAAFIHTKDFQQVCRQYPEVALKLLAGAGRRLRQLVAVIELVTFGSVRQRLAGVLLDLGKDAGSDAFPLAATHQELASHLGTVREVVSRNISRFQSEGLIRMSGRQMELLDRDGLRREAETEL